MECVSRNPSFGSRVLTFSLVVSLVGESLGGAFSVGETSWSPRKVSNHESLVTQALSSRAWLFWGRGKLNSNGALRLAQEVEALQKSSKELVVRPPLETPEMPLNAEEAQERQWARVIKHQLAESLYFHPLYPLYHLDFDGLLRHFLPDPEREGLVKILAQALAVAWLPARNAVYPYRGAERMTSHEDRAWMKSLYPDRSKFTDLSEYNRRFKIMQLVERAHQEFIRLLMEFMQFSQNEDVEEQIHLLEPLTVAFLGQKAFQTVADWYRQDSNHYRQETTHEQAVFVEAQFRDLHEAKYVPFIQEHFQLSPLVPASDELTDIIDITVLDIEQSLLRDASLSNPIRVLDEKGLRRDMETLKDCILERVEFADAVARLRVITPVDLAVQFIAARMAIDQNTRKALLKGRQRIASYLVDRHKHRFYARYSEIYAPLLVESDWADWATIHRYPYRSPQGWFAAALEGATELLGDASMLMEDQLRMLESLPRQAPITMGLLESCEAQKLSLQIGLEPYAKQNAKLENTPHGLIHFDGSSTVEVSGWSQAIPIDKIEWMTISNSGWRDEVAADNLLKMPESDDSFAWHATAAAVWTMQKNALDPTLAKEISFYLLQHVKGWRPDKVGFAQWLTENPNSRLQSAFWRPDMPHMLAMLGEALDEMSQMAAGAQRLTTAEENRGVKLYALAYPIAADRRLKSSSPIPVHEIMEWLYRYILGKIQLQELLGVISLTPDQDIPILFVLARMSWERGGLDREAQNGLFIDLSLWRSGFLASDEMARTAIEGRGDEIKLLFNTAKAMLEDHILNVSEPLPIKIPASRWTKAFEYNPQIPVPKSLLRAA